PVPEDVDKCDEGRPAHYEREQGRDDEPLTARVLERTLKGRPPDELAKPQENRDRVALRDVARASRGGSHRRHLAGSWSNSPTAPTIDPAAPSPSVRRSARVSQRWKSRYPFGSGHHIPSKFADEHCSPSFMQIADLRCTIAVGENMPG